MLMSVGIIFVEFLQVDEVSVEFVDDVGELGVGADLEGFLVHGDEDGYLVISGGGIGVVE